MKDPHARLAWSPRAIALGSVLTLVLALPALRSPDGGGDGAGRTPALAPVRDVRQQVSFVQAGDTRDGTVHLQRWIVHGNRQIEALPLPGDDGAVRMLQLAAGEVTSIVNGQRIERLEGDWWNVPPGAVLGLQTGNDAAVLWAVTVAP